MTRDDLYGLVQDYTENQEDSFLNNLNMFVRQTEEIIWRTAELPAQTNNGTVSTAANNKNITLPSDFLAFDNVVLVDPVTGARTPLVNKEQDYVLEAYGALPAGRPRVYALTSPLQAWVGPTPDGVYVIEIDYKCKPASLADAGATGVTWLSQNASNALLYGTLYHAYLYMKGDQDVLSQYRDLFIQCIAGAKKLGEFDNRRDDFRNRGPFPVDRTPQVS